MPRILAASELDELIQLLARRGYAVIGPVVRDGAIVYEPVKNVADLPAGWTDEQEAGHYRLNRRTDQALFGFNVGPQSWKKFLHPPEVKLFSADRPNGALKISATEKSPLRYAFLGVRGCELAAIGIQDRVLTRDQFADPVYSNRRDGVFIVAVRCTQAAPTCFCHSAAPWSQAIAFDLSLTELMDQQGHRFLVQVGSERGGEILSELHHEPATDADCELAQAATKRAASQQTRHLDTEGLKDLVLQNFDHPNWEKVAQRCLTCANCTMVCPTCFCTTVEDTSDLTGDHAERWRRWDSCFTLNFSYIHGGSVRTSPKARYRQWLTHKFASWIDQFGTPGCVGCGRCITWCPAGIDLTRELKALRETVTAKTERQDSVAIEEGPQGSIDNHANTHA
jgi:ferredoxin